MSVLTLLLATALAFPVPASAPIPVTAPVLFRPPFAQTGLRVASNGTIALAVWNDLRNGGLEITACRIAADGTPLDPTGIVVQTGSNVVDVFWTGSSFAVVMQVVLILHPGDVGYTVSYVSPDGAVTPGSALASNLMVYGARSDDGADARILFLPQDGFPGLASVVDLQGNTVRQGGGDHGSAMYFRAASNGSAFLVIRGVAVNGGIGGQATFVAEVLDRDGNALSSYDPQLPSTFVPEALTGDGQGGYALFGFLPPQNGLFVVRLDARGVATAPPQLIQANDPPGSYPSGVNAMMTAGGFVASWMFNSSDHHTFTYVSHDGGPPVMTFDWIGSGAGAAYEPVNDLAFTSYNDAYTSTETDVFVQKGSAWPVPITYSAHQQTNAAIAAGANGFLAAWSENTGTNATLFVRRFSPLGAPLDDPQAADAPPNANDAYLPLQQASVTSSGDAYLVTWDRAFARRIEARTGRWLDAAPFQLFSMAAASNGSDVLALTAETCQSGCTMARRVSMTGGPVVSDGVRLSDYRWASQPALASDGQNYLAVWNDGAGDCSLCPLPPATRLVVMRLRPDGSHIDAAPVVVDPATQLQANPSVAWNGSTYLVTWTTWDGSISAAYVSADGVVRPLGTIARLNRLITAIKTVAHAGEFLILTRHDEAGGFPLPNQLSVTLLDGSTVPIDDRPSDRFGAIDAASDGVHLMLAYDHLDAQAGRVGRVVLDPRVFPSRRRAFH